MALTPARITQINNRLAVLRPRRLELQKERNDIDLKRERLQTARNQLENQLADHTTFRSAVRNAIEPVEKTRLRGNNRSKLTDRLRNMRDNLVVARDRHQANIERIQTRRNQLADRRTTVINRMTATTNEINELQKELNQL